MKKHATAIPWRQIAACVTVSFFLFVGNNGFSQAKFISEGKIEYERKINVHRQVPDEDLQADWFKDMVKTQPAFHTSTFSLQFKNDQTIYKPEGEVPKLNFWWIMGPSKENTVYTDYSKHTRRSYKSVFEQNFIISDSAKANIEWRISDEKRTIAGLDCRKAVGRICDSVYVVAFYTDEIPISGGPESFSGLPGMILGIAIPRLSTTWFATKVQLTEPVQKDFDISTRGTKTDMPKLMKVLAPSMKDWGKYGQRNIWWVML